MRVLLSKCAYPLGKTRKSEPSENEVRFLSCYFGLKNRSIGAVYLCAKGCGGCLFIRVERHSLYLIGTSLVVLAVSIIAYGSDKRRRIGRFAVSL